MNEIINLSWNLQDAIGFLDEVLGQYHEWTRADPEVPTPEKQKTEVKKLEEAKKLIQEVMVSMDDEISRARKEVDDIADQADGASY
jgi:hypothetical protein